MPALLDQCVGVAVLVGVVITCTIVLADVGGIACVVRLSVIHASEDGVGFVLVQEEGVKEAANACRSWCSLVTDIEGALLYAGSGTNRGIVWPKKQLVTVVLF